MKRDYEICCANCKNCHSYYSGDHFCSRWNHGVELEERCNYYSPYYAEDEYCIYGVDSTDKDEDDEDEEDDDEGWL